MTGIITYELNFIEHTVKQLLKSDVYNTPPAMKDRWAASSTFTLMFLWEVDTELSVFYTANCLLCVDFVICYYLIYGRLLSSLCIQPIGLVKGGWKEGKEDEEEEEEDEDEEEKCVCVCVTKVKNLSTLE